MPLTLEQYADWLERRDLLWPAPPEIERPKARAHVVPLPGLRAVLFAPYGGLMAISHGRILFEHPDAFVQSAALEKTIQEFKMWPAMSRKPGKPSEYMGQVYRRQLERQRLRATDALGVVPEVKADELWAEIVKLLIKNEYTFDHGFYGALHEYGAKIAYFFHASLQTPAAYPGALAVVEALRGRGIAVGLLGDGQCFTPVHVLRALRRQGTLGAPGGPMDAGLTVLSAAVGVRVPAEKLFREASRRLAERKIAPEQTLYVASRLSAELAGAKRAGWRTALLARDKSALEARRAEIEAAGTRPDVLLTDLDQLTAVVICGG